MLKIFDRYGSNSSDIEKIAAKSIQITSKRLCECEICEIAVIRSGQIAHRFHWHHSDRADTEHFHSAVCQLHGNRLDRLYAAM